MSRISRREFLIRSVYAAAWTIAPTLIASSKAQGLSYPHGSVQSAVPGRLALIIDDVGFSVERIQPFLEMNVPLTFSILPHLPYSRLLAEKIHDHGHEIMLHQPMEPHNMFIDPGPGALFVSLPHKTVEQIMVRNIESIPYAAGCNNHMGSRYTESRTCMQPTLTLLKERRFFFIDSLTSQRSIAFDTAKTLGMPTACRNVFIDNIREQHYISAQLQQLKHHALRTGYALGIGHPRPETVAALKKFLAGLRGSGITLTYASHLLDTVS
ncbi:MAG: divergent polysaccharide deacetylase family protein [Desulfobacterota bacterium]|nr:divergent polysaccharide deacetylase family protein [Thermodesulfobacteriota bacterium]